MDEAERAALLLQAILTTIIGSYESQPASRPHPLLLRPPSRACLDTLRAPRTIGFDEREPEGGCIR